MAEGFSSVSAYRPASVALSDGSGRYPDAIPSLGKLLLAQSNNPVNGGKPSDLGKGEVQGYGSDGKTVFKARIVWRIYNDGSNATRFYANGKALPVRIQTLDEAKLFVRQQIGKGSLGTLALGDPNAFGRVETDPRTGLQTRLQALPERSGKVSVKSNTSTIATEIKARSEFRGGQWQLTGYVADGVSEYVKRPISLNQKPEAEGYLSRSVGKQTLITDKTGKGITDPALARERVVEMLSHGGLTTKTHELAQQQRRSRVENSTPVVTGTTVKAYVPRVALPKPIAQMTMTDRLAYMRDVAWSKAGKNGLEELKSLTSPQSLFFMAAFAGAQTTPITSLMANGLATLMLGKDVIDTGGKLASSLQAGLTAKTGHELETAGLHMGEAAVHIGARLATGAVGKQVGRVAKNYRETASTRVLERTLVDYKAGKASEGQLRAAVIAASQDQGVRIARPLVPKDRHPGEFERATGAVKPSTAPATQTPKPTPPPVVTMVPDGKGGYRAKASPSVKDFAQKALPPPKSAAQAGGAEALVLKTQQQLASGDLAGAAHSIQALKTAEQLARKAGETPRADAIGVVAHNLEANRKALARQVNAPQYSALKTLEQAKRAWNSPAHWTLEGNLIVPKVAVLVGDSSRRWNGLVEKFGAPLAKQLYDANVRGGFDAANAVLTTAGWSESFTVNDAASLHYAAFTMGRRDYTGKVLVGLPRLHDVFHMLTGTGVAGYQEVANDYYAETLPHYIFSGKEGVNLDLTRKLSDQPEAAQKIKALITRAYASYKADVQVGDEFRFIETAFADPNAIPKQSLNWQSKPLASARRAEKILEDAGLIRHLDAEDRSTIRAMLFGKENPQSFESIAERFKSSGDQNTYRDEVDQWVERVKVEHVARSGKYKMSAQEFELRAMKSVALAITLTTAKPGVFSVEKPQDYHLSSSGRLENLDLRTRYPAMYEDVRKALSN